jgi:uncharacterized Zn finger protein
MTANRQVSELTTPQLVAVAQCHELLKERGQSPVWHFNECGCCVSVHDDREEVHSGAVINQQGEVFWEKCQ